LIAHPTEARSDAALHRAFRLLEHHGDLSIGVATEVGELDGAPLVAGEHLERLANVVGDGEVPDLMFEVVSRLRALALVALLAGYHLWCWRLLRDFAAERNTKSERWLRWFNEFPTVILVATVLLVVFKPF
jgi:hypothetical protein